MNADLLKQTSSIEPRPQPQREVVAPHMARGVLTTMQTRPASEVWTRKQWISMSHHLHNDNSPTGWIMGFLAPNPENGGRPEAQYKRSKNVTAEKGIQWAWSSTCGRGLKKIAFTPYSQNERGESRWASVDFDAHGDDPQGAENARQKAFAFFQCCLNIKGIHVILEASGRGWHVWLLSKEFHPLTFWFKLLSDTLNEAGITELGQGVVECFPRPTTNDNPFGFGMRAPGSWNPNTGSVNQIYWEDVSVLFPASVPLNKEKRISSPKRERSLFLSASLSALYQRGMVIVADHTIGASGTRHHRLASLIGTLFYQVGKKQVELLVREQFKLKTVATKSSEEDHVVESHALWMGLNERWLASLGSADRQVFDGLTEGNERDAFRIISSYRTNAQKKGRPDFAIGRDDLAGRLGISGEGAGKLIKRLMDGGIIKRVCEYKPHKFAARYAWHLDFLVQI